MPFLGNNENCGGRNGGGGIWWKKINNCILSSIKFIPRYPSGDAEKANEYLGLEF